MNEDPFFIDYICIYKTKKKEKEKEKGNTHITRSRQANATTSADIFVTEFTLVRKSTVSPAPYLRSTTWNAKPILKVQCPKLQASQKNHFFMILKGFQPDMEDRIVKTSD